MTIESIVNVLNDINSSLSNTDKDWVLFVRDHKQNIIDSSSKLEITDEIIDKYKYKIYHLLNDQGISKDIYWIILLINDLNDMEDFSSRNFIYIITKSEIMNYFNIYKTTRKYKT